MGVGAGLYMYVVVVQKFTFAISSPDEFLLINVLKSIIYFVRLIYLKSQSMLVLWKLTVTIECLVASTSLQTLRRRLTELRKRPNQQLCNIISTQTYIHTLEVTCILIN